MRGIFIKNLLGIISGWIHAGDWDYHVMNHIKEN